MSVYEFKTQEEADKKLKELEEFFDVKKHRVFCPLIDKYCHFKCVCYTPVKKYQVISSSGMVYKVMEGYCSNYMFSGG